jgi:hypothetical protein
MAGEVLSQVQCFCLAFVPADTAPSAKLLVATENKNEIGCFIKGI